MAQKNIYEFEHLDKQLSNGDHLVRCYNCHERFYPLYRQKFCSDKCVKNSFELLSKNDCSNKIDYRVILEVLSSSPDEITRKIAELAD